MAVKIIMRYLRCTLSMRLHIGGKQINLKCYSDADWASNVKNRRSTSGYVFFVGEGLWHGTTTTTTNSNMIYSGGKIPGNEPGYEGGHLA